MNGNAAWPAEKSGQQQYRHRTWAHLKKELRTPNRKLVGENSVSVWVLSRALRLQDFWRSTVSSLRDMTRMSQAGQAVDYWHWE